MNIIASSSIDQDSQYYFVKEYSLYLGLGMIVACLVVAFLSRRKQDPLQSMLFRVRWLLFIWALYGFGMMKMLPTTPVLSTFGRAASIEDVSNPRQLLLLLQRNNDALVRAIQVVESTFDTFFFFGVFILIFIRCDPPKSTVAAATGS